MKKNVLSNKEMNVVVRDAKKNVKEYASNPFRIINDLNKAAKKNEYCNNVSIKAVADICKGLHSNRYAFDACLFCKFDSRFYLATELQGYNEADFLHGDTLADNKGRLVIWSDAKKCALSLQPVSISYTGIFAAFCKVANIEVRTTNKAIKDAEKAAKAAAKAKAKAAKDYEAQCRNIARDFAAGLITEAELSEKLTAAKAAFDAAKAA